MATKHHGTEAERRALDTYIKLARSSAALDARINRPLAQAGLTTSQFGVLEAVWHLGPLTHGDIGRKLLKSSGNVTVVIDNLVRRGLVRRERDPLDRRISRVALSDEGRALLEAVFPTHVDRVVDAFAALTPGELDTLGDLLRRLGRDVAARTPSEPLVTTSASAARRAEHPTHAPQEESV